MAEMGKRRGQKAIPSLFFFTNSDQPADAPPSSHPCRIFSKSNTKMTPLQQKATSLKKSHLYKSIPENIKNTRRSIETQANPDPSEEKFDLEGFQIEISQ